MHKSVLIKETIEALHINSHSRYIDATLGAGGHTAEIAKLGGIVLALDADREMLEIAQENLKAHTTITYAHGNFEDIESIAKKNGFAKVSGILFDLGISSYHLDNFDRGFSFRNKDVALDMRLNPEVQKVTAADLLNALREDQLKEMFLTVLEYRQAVQLSKKIVKAREEKSFYQVEDLLKIISHEDKSVIFMALRIAVNREIEILKNALPKAFELLEPGGKLVIISFHSGEDQVVKHFFAEYAQIGIAQIINKKPIVPETKEINENNRARSAKLRILEKL